MPPNVIFSTKTEGELIPKLNCRSSAGSNFEKILVRFPAIVISETGNKISPFSIKNQMPLYYNLH